MMRVPPRFPSRGGGPPSESAEAAGALDDVTSKQLGREGELKRRVLVLCEVLMDAGGEDGRLNEPIRWERSMFLHDRHVHVHWTGSARGARYAVRVHERKQHPWRSQRG